MSSRSDIAIVGMAATYAGSSDVGAYWQNIVDGVSCIGDAPPGWGDPYVDVESDSNDRIYTQRGGFLGDRAEFDPMEFGIMPNAVDGGEPDQYLALKLARDALRDAGYEDRPFDREMTGVILGRGTYVNRGYTNLMQHGLVVDQTLSVIESLMPELGRVELDYIRDGLKSSLPPFNPEMCPGLVPNVVTGRIANRLDLMGPNYIIDAACASSMIAVQAAISELSSGRVDMMITGGVHASTPPQIYMIFCQIDALSRSDLRPFDAAADGVLLGEGVGLMILKRLQDAERDDDRIYAVIKGIGTSSDGKALGLLAPRLEGEVLALRRAYAAADVDPATVELVEAHGTGIPLGDQTEVRALSTVFGERGNALPRCALGSVKSMISHCIPAAGAAGMIKTAMALHTKTLPATLCGEVSPLLGIEQTPFYINTATRPWIHSSGSCRRAGVNAFGFGGINAHVVMEEYRPPKPVSAGVSTPVSTRVSLPVRASRWPSELVVLSADSPKALAGRIETLRGFLAANPDVEIDQLAATLGDETTGSHRLALVVKGPAELDAKLERALAKLEKKAGQPFQTRDGLFYATGKAPGKVAVLFPGEGSQYAGLFADLCLHIPKIREWFDFLEETCGDGRACRPRDALFPPPTSLSPGQAEEAEAVLFGMELGPESVFTASMAAWEFVRDLGVECHAMVGHSTGENTALVASGVLQFPDRSAIARGMRELNEIYRRLEDSGEIPRGMLLTVGAIDTDELSQIVEESEGRLYLAMDNCPNQAVVFGKREDVDRLRQRLAPLGAVCVELPFDRAYHTKLFEPVARAFREFYDSVDTGPPAIPVYSCTSLDFFGDEPEATREMAAAQWASRVCFREAINNLYSEGFRAFVELGPSSNLTSFVGDTLRGRPHLAASIDSRRKPGLEQLQHLVGRLFVNGVLPGIEKLFSDRPLERMDLSSTAEPAAKPGKRTRLRLDMPIAQLPEDVLEKVRRPLSGRTDRTDRPERIPETVREPLPNATAAQAPLPPTVVSLEAPRSVAPPDVREQALQQHFGLMQEFLAGQARTFAQMSGGTPLATAAAEVQASAGVQLPPIAGTMLGERLADSDQGIGFACQIDVNEHLFLRDHTLGGQPSRNDSTLLPLPVVPFTFSMELIAQAAAALAPERSVVAMRNLRGYRWLSLDQGVISLRVQASQLQPSEGGHASTVRVYQLEDGSLAGGVLVFEGEVVLGQRPSQAPIPIALPAATRPTGLPDADLYSTGMFHGPLLQGVKHIRGWSEQGIEADLEVLPVDAFCATTAPSYLTDPGLLDAAGQLVGYWLSEQFGSDFNCFPFQVDECTLYASPFAPGTRVVCRAAIKFENEGQITAEIDLLTEDGSLIARICGWRDRYFSIPPEFYQYRLEPQKAYLSQPWTDPGEGIVGRRIDPFPDSFFEQGWAIWLRVLAHLILNQTERRDWNALAGSPQYRTDWLLGRLAAKDAVREWARQHGDIELAPADVEIRKTEGGRPSVVAPALGALAPPAISIAHSEGSILALAGEGHLGVDLERNAPSPDALRLAFSDDERRLAESHCEPPAARVILAMWCAKEAAAKALGTGLNGTPLEWQVVEATADARRLTVKYRGQSFPVSIQFDENEVRAVCALTASGQTDRQ